MPSGTTCEVGFGQGRSANIHATASVTQWHGTDFNHAQAAFAQGAGGGLRLRRTPAAIARSKRPADKLNAHLMDKARGSNDISYLASPVTGGGHTVGRFQQMFLLALAQGRKQPADWAQYAWQILAAQGQKLVNEGRTLESSEKTLPNSRLRPPHLQPSSCLS
jgi:hypothetical protein